mmetsp:Transcript_105602/g.147213  ORF Transcript_105602/g.147213 Transcript_105602/m.147213 type:complete len:200 (+) Transcript_105602:162-761(+)
MKFVPKKWYRQTQIERITRGIRIWLDDWIVDGLQWKTFLLQEITVLWTIQAMDRAEFGYLGALELQEVRLLPWQALVEAHWRHTVLTVLFVNLPPRRILFHLVDDFLGLQELQRIDDKALGLHLVASEANFLHQIHGFHRRIAERFLHVLEQHGGDPFHDDFVAQLAVGHSLVELLLVTLGMFLLHGIKRHRTRGMSGH